MDQDHQHLVDALGTASEAGLDDGIQILPDEPRHRVGPADVLVALAGLAALTVVLLLILL